MQTAEDLLQKIREHRSSEGNFETLYGVLQEAKKFAEQNNNTELADELNEADEKYAAEYKRAKEVGGSAWPEFEKFVSQLERSLTEANRS